MKRKTSKHTNKRILSTLTAVTLLIVSLFCTQPLNVQAAGHTQDEAVAWANSQIGKGLDYDKVYGNQCVDLIKYYYDYFGVAGYAMGNASAYVSNEIPPGWTRVYSGYQPGDVAVWKVNHSCNTCNTGSLGHVGIILSADSSGFNAVNQNFNNNTTCTKNWFNISALACAIRPNYSGGSQAQPQPEPSVSFADFNQNAVWDTNAEMYTKIMNPNRAHVTSCGCYLYDSSGALLTSYSEDCDYRTSYVNYNCNINNDMNYTLKPGTTYQFVLFGVVDGKEYRDVMRSFTTTGSSDMEAPVISDVAIAEQGESGYMIRCRVTDNEGVDRVQFPTWTEANGQDDIQADWGTSSAASGVLDADGYYTYRVNVSDHNYELGIYITHIYAYDKAGNFSTYNLRVMAEEDKLDAPQATPGMDLPQVTPGADVGQQTQTPIVSPTQNPASHPTQSTVVQPTQKPSEDITVESDSDSGSIPVSDVVKKPGKVKNVRVKNLKGRRVKATWKSAGRDCIYQVQIARNRTFTKGKLTDETSNRFMNYCKRQIRTWMEKIAALMLS